MHILIYDLFLLPHFFSSPFRIQPRKKNNKGIKKTCLFIYLFVYVFKHPTRHDYKERIDTRRRSLSEYAQEENLHTSIQFVI